jgi:CheY-like chemotaxis protein
MGLDLLVVDDSLTVRKLVDLAFRDSDARLTFAASGVEGLALAASGTPQVVLLDYVLPDMKGADVCRQLAKDPRLSRVPVVLMSAKRLDLRSQFTAFPAVVDFINKPFSREEIVGVVRRAASRTTTDGVPPRKADGTSGPELFSHERKQTAARLLFRHLRAQLEQIPLWAKQVGEAPAASYFARKLFTPEVMERMLTELGPVVLEAVTEASDGSSRLSGRLSGSELMDLLRMLEGGRRTGTLSLGHPASGLIVHWRSGSIVLASCFDPDEYQRDAELSLVALDAEARSRAEDEQRRIGKPVYATLAEAGLLAAPEAQRAISQQGRRLLRGLLRETACRLEWRGEEPPCLCGALERPISVTQLWLERLRAVAALADVERRVPSFQAIFERAEGFSARLRQLDLSKSERSILALIDGRASVQELIERSGVASREVAHVLFRLVEVGLLRQCAGLSPRPKVMILEPDVEGFRRPLAALLESRPRPADLVPLEQLDDLVSTVVRARPVLVLLNASALGTEQTEDIARSICTHPDCSSAVVALLEPGGVTGGALPECPYLEAVLTKPVHVSEIERLLPS